MAPETEALTPAPAGPEDAAAVPAAPDQLAALPAQPEVSDTVLAQEGGTTVAPEQDEPSLDAVARLLRERKDDLLEHIRVYLDARPEIYDWLRPGIFRILDLKGLSHVGDTYRVRVLYEDRLSRTTSTYIYPKIQVLDLLLELDGDNFEIVGHELPPAWDQERAASLPERQLQPANAETAERAVP